MKKTLIILILLITSTGSLTFSQDTSIVTFLPLKVGNVWLYQYSAFSMNPPCYASELIRVRLIGTSVYDGKTYFQSQITKIVAGGYGGSGAGFSGQAAGSTLVPVAGRWQPLPATEVYTGAGLCAV